MRVVLIFIVVLLAGCGYHVPGASTSPAKASTPRDITADTWVGGDARVLYVQLFVNQTSIPYLENYITTALIAELSRSRLVELTENQDLAGVSLVGDVDEFRSDAFGYGATDRITNYRANMKVSVRLLRKGSDEVLWRETLQRSEDYLATVNKNLQLEGERLAARLVSQRLAEDIHAGLLNSF